MTGARLQENGELRFIPRLKSVAKMAELQGTPVQKREDFLDKDTIQTLLRRQWDKPW